MHIDVRYISDWSNALSAARFTVGKVTPDGKQPSQNWRDSMCRAMHSPLREVLFRIYCYEMPRRAMSHLVRHFNGIEKYVQTSRPDRTTDADNETVNVAFTVNAQALINISQKRLCTKAWHETRDSWMQIIEAVREIDPVVASYCLPSCVFYGYCPEMDGCGFVGTEDYSKKREELIS